MVNVAKKLTNGQTTKEKDLSMKDELGLITYKKRSSTDGGDQPADDDDDTSVILRRPAAALRRPAAALRRPAAGDDDDSDGVAPGAPEAEHPP
eukprot:9348307-Pyramimonas_sp.AAC.1